MRPSSLAAPRRAPSRASSAARADSPCGAARSPAGSARGAPRVEVERGLERARRLVVVSEARGAPAEVRLDVRIVGPRARRRASSSCASSRGSGCPRARGSSRASSPGPGRSARPRAGRAARPRRPGPARRRSPAPRACEARGLVGTARERRVDGRSRFGVPAEAAEGVRAKELRRRRGARRGVETASARAGSGREQRAAEAERRLLGAGETDVVPYAATASSRRPRAA